VSYSIPIPVSDSVIVGRSTMFSDDTFDGRQTSSGFTQGLGQLADGVQGEDIQIVTTFFAKLLRTDLTHI